MDPPAFLGFVFSQEQEDGSVPLKKESWGVLISGVPESLKFSFVCLNLVSQIMTPTPLITGF